MDSNDSVRVQSQHATPRRRAGSVRRTTTHDCTRPDGVEGPVVIAASGRDLLTDIDRSAVLLDAASLDVRADFGSATFERLRADPPHPALAGLGGANAFRGFRARIDEAIPEDRDSGSVRYQLLDDLPIALMLSGRVLRVAGLGLSMGDRRRLPVDICAGWADGGTLLAGLSEDGPPLHLGPVAADLRPADDALGWHDFGPLTAHATRRQRRLDVWHNETHAEVDCFFRDSFADADGVETVVHQYRVRATVEPATSRFISCEAEPGPLPYPECPRAVASAGRLAGATAYGLRREVRSDFVGPTTCTHLNDTLRSMQDVTVLLDALRDRVSRPR